MAEVATVNNNGNTLIYDEQVRQDLSSPSQRAIYAETEKKEPILPFSYEAKVSILTQAVNSHPVFNTIMNSIRGTSAYIDRGTLADIIIGQYMTIDSMSEAYANTKGVPLISAEVLGRIINSVKEVEIDEVVNGVVLNPDGTVNRLSSAIQLGEMYGVPLEQALAMQKDGLANIAKMNQPESFIPRNMSDAMNELESANKRQVLLDTLLSNYSNSFSYYGNYNSPFDNSSLNADISAFEAFVAGIGFDRIDELDDDATELTARTNSSVAEWTKGHSQSELFQIYIQKEFEAEIISMLNGYHMIDGTATPEDEKNLMDTILNSVSEEMTTRGLKDVRDLHSDIINNIIDENGIITIEKVREFASKVIEGINNQSIHQSLTKFQGMHQNGANISEMESYEYSKLLTDMCAAYYSNNPIIQAAFYEGMLPNILDKNNKPLVTLAPGEKLTENEFFELINSMNDGGFTGIDDPKYQLLRRISLVDKNNLFDRMESIGRTIKKYGETDYDFSGKSLEERTKIINADQYQISLRGKKEYEKNNYSIQKNEIVSEVESIKENDIKTNQKTLLKTYLEIYRREFIRVHGREPDPNSVRDYSEEFADATTAQRMKEVLHEQGIYQFLIDDDGMVIPEAVKQVDSEFAPNDRRISRQVSKIERVSSRGAREDYKNWIKFDKLEQLIESFDDNSSPSEEISKMSREERIEKIKSVLGELPKEMLTSARVIQTIESDYLEDKEKADIKKIINDERKKERERERRLVKKQQNKDGFIDIEKESAYDGRVLKQGSLLKRAVIGTSERLQQFRRNLELNMTKKTGIGIEQILENNGDERALVEQKASRWQKLMMGLRNALGDAETDATRSMRFSHQAFLMGITLEDGMDIPVHNLQRSLSNPEAMSKYEKTDDSGTLSELQKMLLEKQKQRVGKNIIAFNVLNRNVPSLEEMIEDNRLSYLEVTEPRAMFNAIVQSEKLRHPHVTKRVTKPDERVDSIREKIGIEDDVKVYSIKSGKSEDTKQFEEDEFVKMKEFNLTSKKKKQGLRDKVKITSYRKTDSSFLGKFFNRRKKKAQEYALARKRSMAGDKEFERKRKDRIDFVTRPEEYQNQNEKAVDDLYTIFESANNLGYDTNTSLENEGVSIQDYSDVVNNHNYTIETVNVELSESQLKELEVASVSDSLPGVEPIKFKELVRGDFPVYEQGADKVIETDSTNPDMTVDSQSLEQLDLESGESILPGSIAKVSSVDIAAKTADAEEIIFTSMGTMVDDIDKINEFQDILPGVEEQYVGAGSFITNQTSVKQRVEAAADRAKADGEVSKATYERMQQEKADKQLSDRQPIAEALAAGAMEGYKKGFEAGQKQTFEEIIEQAQNGNFVQGNKWQLPTEYTKATNKQGRSAQNPSYSSKGVTKMDPTVKKKKEEMAQKKAKAKQTPDSGR